MTFESTIQAGRGAMFDAFSERPPAADPRYITPSIVVAIDARGAAVCQRLATLIRSDSRMIDAEGGAAFRDRFGFLKVNPDNNTRYLTTEVQTIRIEPSAELWDINVERWEERPLVTDGAQTFSAAFEAALKQVLSYAVVRDQLLEQGYAVTGSMLNVFFVGSIIEQESSPDAAEAVNLTEEQLIDRMQETIRIKLEELLRLSERARDYAIDSASIDLVVRGAFLTLVLPDSREIARAAFEGSGTSLGDLLRVSAVDREPPLHFCALYSSHDENGAWYDAEQLANATAGAIYSLMLSELAGQRLVRQQLGIEDPWMSPYDRLIAIAAARSAFPKTELLDFAALRYGAALLQQLLPDPAPTSPPEQVVRRRVDALLGMPDFARQFQRPVGRNWDRNGAPRRLTAATQTSSPPDLSALIQVPRRGFLQNWDGYVDDALASIERHDRLHAVLTSPDGYPQTFVDENGAPLNLAPLEPGGPPVRYLESELLEAWHQWRQRLDTTIGTEPRDVTARIEAIRNEVERAFWGSDDVTDAASGIGYVNQLIDEVERIGREIRTTIERDEPRPTPVELDSAALLQRARRLVRRRVELGPVALLSLVVAVVFSYLFFAAREGSVGRFEALVNRPDLAVELPLIAVTVVIPNPMVLGASCGVVVFSLGLLLRQIQLQLAIRPIKDYATGVRRRYAIAMYNEEVVRLREIPAQIELFLNYLRLEVSVRHEVVRLATERLLQRAERIGTERFVDVTEYVSLSGSNAPRIYRSYLEPLLRLRLNDDLRVLRAAAVSMGPVTAGVATAEFRPQLLDRARRQIFGLVQGSPDVSEQSNAAGLRHLAYASVSRDIERIVADSISQSFSSRIERLRTRTPLLVTEAFRPGQEKFEQDYTVVPTVATNRSPALIDTIEVRSLNPQSVMFVRIVSRFWPRIFESVSIKLTVQGGQGG